MQNDIYLYKTPLYYLPESSDIFYYNESPLVDFPFFPPMPAIPNTLQQPAALDINTKSHISLILSDRDVLLTPQKKSF